MTDPYDRIIWSADLPTVNAVTEMLDHMPKLRWVKIDRAFLDDNEDGWDIFPILRERGIQIFDDAKAIEVDHKLEKIARAHARRASPQILNCMAGAITFSSKRKVDALRRFAAVCRDNDIETCGVSVLTSKDDEVVYGEFNGRIPREQVLWYAYHLFQAGFDMMVCSPQEAEIIKDEQDLGPLQLITPGIRPTGSAMGSQARAATPAQAIAAGADYLVIGGPITDADDPAAALEAMAREIEPLLLKGNEG